MIQRTLGLTLVFMTLLTHCADEPAQDGTPAADAAADAKKDAAADVGSRVDADAASLPDVQNDRETAADVGPDRTSEASPPDAADAADATDATDAADATDGADASDVGAPDRVSDAPISDGHPTDGRVCGATETVAYLVAGCGASAPPTSCQGPTDACVTVFCDCSGQTFSGGCGFAEKPYRSVGPCADGAVVFDASADR